MKRPTEVQTARIHALAALHNGRPTAEIVVADAADPQSVLHDLFPWDDAKAAHQHRLDEARTLLRAVLYVQHGVLEIATPFYVRDPTVPAQQQGYISVMALRTDEAAARETVRVECARVESALLRAQRVAAAVGCMDLIADLLERLQTLKVAVQEPEPDIAPPPAAHAPL